MLDVGWGDLLSHGKDPNTHSMSRARGGFLLKEYESKQLLSTYGIPTVDTRIALTQDEAVKHAADIGYPVALKLFSEIITHKT